MSVRLHPSGVLGRLTLIQGNEFWVDGTKSIPRRSPPRRGPSPPPRRNFFNFLYFRRPVDASPSISLKARHWNFSLFTGRIPAHTVDVAPARDEDVSRSSLVLLVLGITVIIFRDMPSPLRPRRKWLQLCNMRSTMRPIVERHKVKLRRGHKAPNSVHKDSRRRSPFSLCKTLPLAYTNHHMR
jgi:hypothetical protein